MKQTSDTQDTILRISRPSPIARWMGFSAAIFISLTGIFISFTQISNLQLFFAFLALVLGTLAGVFVDSFLSRWFHVGEKICLQEKTILLKGKQPLSFDLAQPFSVLLWKGEGDHKERGGLVFLSLQQEEKSLKIFGDLGHHEIEETPKRFLENAVGVPLLDMIEAGGLSNVIQLPDIGAISEILSLLEAQKEFGRFHGVFSETSHTITLTPETLFIDGNPLPFSEIKGVFSTHSQKQSKLYLQDQSQCLAFISKTFRRETFPTPTHIPLSCKEIPLQNPLIAQYIVFRSRHAGQLANTSTSSP